MNANTRIRHQQLTATQVLVSARMPCAEEGSPSIFVRIGRCLIAPAVIAVLMLGAHWSVFGSVTGNELEAMDQEIEAEHDFPAEYAFRAADFDDPFNYR